MGTILSLLSSLFGSDLGSWPLWFYIGSMLVTILWLWAAFRFIHKKVDNLVLNVVRCTSRSNLFPII